MKLCRRSGVNHSPASYANLTTIPHLSDDARGDARFGGHEARDAHVQQAEGAAYACGHGGDGGDENEHGKAAVDKGRTPAVDMVRTPAADMEHTREEGKDKQKAPLWKN